MKHKGFTLWLTGMSGAGKSTISDQLMARFRDAQAKVELLDGDVVRTNLSQGLGFSRGDRDTNVRRIGFVCELLSRNGVIAVVAAISPYRSTREEVKGRIANFVEVHVDCPVEVLASRDVKGLYKKALTGEVSNFTGISDPYEPPEHPDVHVRTDLETLDQSVDKVWSELERRGLIDARQPLVAAPEVPEPELLPPATAEKRACSSEAHEPRTAAPTSQEHSGAAVRARVPQETRHD